jgi:polar amino acid transport system substrate-binding protein
MRWRSHLALVAGFALCLIFTANILLAANPSPKQSVSRIRVRIGSANRYPPYSWINYEGHPAGFLVDLTRAVAEAAGINYELVTDDFDLIQTRLASGGLEAVNGMRYSIERDASYDFSQPHLLISHSIFVWSEDKNIRGLRDLKGRSVLVVRGDNMHEFLLQEKTGVNLKFAGSIKDAISLLSLHRAEAAVLDRYSALYYIRELNLSNLKEIGKPFETFEFCFAVREDRRDLIELFNQGLAAVKESGHYDRLLKKWIDPLEPRADVRAYIPYIVSGGAAVIAIIFFLWFWNWLLQHEVRMKTEALRIANEELKRVDEYKTEVVRMVSHDIRAPLGVIQGYTDYLQQGYAGEVGDKQKDILRRILNSVDRMNKLVNDLLDMSRIESGKLELNWGPVNAARLTDDIFSFFQDPMKDKQIAFEKDVPPSEFVFDADRNRIEQCLINLLANALKHTPSGGRIRLEVAGGQHSVCFKVHDSGSGIERKNLGKLFQEFERGRENHTPGFGLGLAITKGLVDLHHGKIWAESKEGEGSVFAFSIPKHQRPGI